VSPLWRDQICIALSPSQVSLVRFARGWTPRITEKRTVSCNLTSPGDTSWRHSLETLQTMLPDFAKHHCNVKVVLSNHYVRYLLVPYSDQIINETEDLELVRHSFSRSYGQNTGQWAIRYSDDGHSTGPRVAGAIDQGLLESLNAIFLNTRMNLRSVQPYLMAAFNQWRHQLSDNAWLALVEHGRLCLAQVQNGQWYSIKGMRIGDDWLNELCIILEREKLLASHDATSAAHATPVFVLAPDKSTLSTAQQQEHSIQILRPAYSSTMDADAPSAMAIAG
jgi:hypothetical protein